MAEPPPPPQPSPPPPPSAPPASRGRMWIVRGLVVLGAIFAAISALAGYVRWQVFDEDTFEETSAQLIADDAVRDQIAAKMVDSLFSNVDVTAALEERLPAEQQGLAAPLAGAFRELSDRAAERVLERPRVQDLWVRSTVTTQRQLERLLDDDLTAVQTEGGYAVLNLRPLVVQLGDQVAIVGRLATRLPDDAGVIRIMEAEQLEAAQDATQLFKSVAAFIWIVPLALWALAIWLARGRRRQALRMVAIGIALTGLLLLVARRVAGSYVVDELAASESVKPAVQDAWDIITSLLADGAWMLIGIGFVTLIGVWVAGPTASGTAVRRFIAPYVVRPEIAFGGAALLLLLLVWWGPTAQTRRVSFILVLAVLLALGVEALRRVIAREEPSTAARTE
jgi:hypothetical protein